MRQPSRMWLKVLATVLAGGMLLQTTSCAWQDVLYDAGVGALDALVTSLTDALTSSDTSTSS
jgi:hypothetical protein